MTLADYAGRAVAFLFVSSRCAPCREALPRFEALRPAAARAGVDLVLVSVDEAKTARAFAAEFGLSLPILVAPQQTNPFMADYNIIGTPSYCLVDALGRVKSAGRPNPAWGEWKILTELWVATEAPQVITSASIGEEVSHNMRA